MEQGKGINQQKEKYENQENDNLYPGVLTKNDNLYPGVLTTEVYKNGSLCIDRTPVASRHQNTCNLASWAFSPVPVISPVPADSTYLRKSGSSGIQISNVTSIPTSEYYNSYSPDISYSVHNSSSTTQSEWAPHQVQWYYHPNYTHSGQSNTGRNTNEYSESILARQPDHTVPMYECSNSATEIARCSTPELITALANLTGEKPSEKVDRSSTTYYTDQTTTISPTETKPNIRRQQIPGMHSESDNNPMLMHLGQYLQDSGYSSDLCMSPVYPYESKFSNHAKGGNVSSDEENKENLYIDSDVSVQSCVTSQVQKSLFYKEYSNNNVAKSSDGFNSMVNILGGIQKQLQTSHIQSSQVSSSNYLTHQNKNTQDNKTIKSILMQNMAENQDKKTDTKKKKVQSDNKTEMEIKRSRHNQPLNNQATRTMMEWYEAHKDNPYPSKADKERMAEEGGITITQVKSWFANKRNRNNNTRPKVQKRQMTERLLGICHQLARDAKQPSMNNADIIQQLSGLINDIPEHE